MCGWSAALAEFAQAVQKSQISPRTSRNYGARGSFLSANATSCMYPSAQACHRLVFGSQ